MAKSIGPRFKIARRLGVNVFGHPKALTRGVTSRRKTSEYGEQLIEKQKLRMYYGVLEKQFRRYVNEAFKSAANPGEVLVTLLERRLDNLVYRLGFAATLRQSRQMVVHGHITVNGQRVDRPSFRIYPGDVMALSEKAKQMQTFVDNFRESALTVPYLEKDTEGLSGKLIRMPQADEIPIEVKISKVLEFYSGR